jgi:hypothetical protein
MFNKLNVQYKTDSVQLGIAVTSITNKKVLDMIPRTTPVFILASSKESVSLPIDFNGRNIHMIKLPLWREGYTFNGAALLNVLQALTIPALKCTGNYINTVFLTGAMESEFNLGSNPVTTYCNFTGNIEYHIVNAEWYIKEANKYENKEIHERWLNSARTINTKLPNYIAELVAAKPQLSWHTVSASFIEEIQISNAGTTHVSNPYMSGAEGILPYGSTNISGGIGNANTNILSGPGILPATISPYGTSESAGQIVTDAAIKLWATSLLNAGISQVLQTISPLNKSNSDDFTKTMAPYAEACARVYGGKSFVLAKGLKDVSSNIKTFISENKQLITQVGV